MSGLLSGSDGRFEPRCVSIFVVQHYTLEEMIGRVRMVREVEYGRQVIDSVLLPPRPKQMPDTILEVLVD